MRKAGSRPVRRAVAAAAATATAALVLTTAGCGTETTSADIMSDSGWPGAHGDAHNSGVSSVSGARTLYPAWTRTLDGAVASAASIAPDGQVFVAATTAAGCNLFGYEMSSGRQRFCDHVELTAPTAAGVVATPLVDADDNAYLGFDDGWVHSYNEHGQERWAMQLLGTAQSAVFTREGDVAVVSHMGEVRVFGKQTGALVTAPLRLLGQPDRRTQPNLPWPPNDENLADCADGKPSCTVPAPPAIDPSTDTLFLPVWYPGKSNASVVALRYADGALTRVWAADVLAGGTVAAPVLSADARTVYVADTAGELLALDARTGARRWSFPLGFRATGLSVSPDGLILPGGSAGSRALALRDKGDHAESAWSRTDLSLRGVPVQTAGATAYAVARSADDPRPTLLVLDTATGATLAHHPLAPAPAGRSTGQAEPVADESQRTAAISVGPHGEVVVAASDGVLYAFTTSQSPR